MIEFICAFQCAGCEHEVIPDGDDYKLTQGRPNNPKEFSRRFSEEFGWYWLDIPCLENPEEYYDFMLCPECAGATGIAVDGVMTTEQYEILELLYNLDYYKSLRS